MMQDFVIKIYLSLAGNMRIFNQYMGWVCEVKRGFNPYGNTASCNISLKGFNQSPYLLANIYVQTHISYQVGYIQYRIP